MIAHQSPYGNPLPPYVCRCPVVSGGPMPVPDCPMHAGQWGRELVKARAEVAGLREQLAKAHSVRQGWQGAYHEECQTRRRLAAEVAKLRAERDELHGWIDERRDRLAAHVDAAPPGQLQPLTPSQTRIDPDTADLDALRAEVRALDLRLRWAYDHLDEEATFGLVALRTVAGQRDKARAEVAALREKIRGYENAITWDTSCVRCATVLDSMYAETVRAETAEATVERVRAWMRVEGDSTDDMSDWQKGYRAAANRATVATRPESAPKNALTDTAPPTPLCGAP
jgi:hypothetical protein